MHIFFLILFILHLRLLELHAARYNHINAIHGHSTFGILSPHIMSYCKCADSDRRNTANNNPHQISHGAFAIFASFAPCHFHCSTHRNRIRIRCTSLTTTVSLRHWTETHHSIVSPFCARFRSISQTSRIVSTARFAPDSVFNRIERIAVKVVQRDHIASFVVDIQTGHFGRIQCACWIHHDHHYIHLRLLHSVNHIWAYTVSRWLTIGDQEHDICSLLAAIGARKPVIPVFVQYAIDRIPRFRHSSHIVLVATQCSGKCRSIARR
mmetsp:Transcript_29398/g.46680  ORF Transcript_29398/g.46680 Transcript_29398/m.46680 type:complete len:266 (-) Transcript_29398:508-1305(-)